MHALLPSLRTVIRILGRAHNRLGELIASQLQVEPSRVELTHVGLNHLSWELDVALVSADGSSRESVLQRVITEFGPALTEELELPADQNFRAGPWSMALQMLNLQPI